MSWHALVVINCDVCGTPIEFDAWGATVAETRATAKLIGWVRRGPWDHCPEHASS